MKRLPGKLKLLKHVWQQGTGLMFKRKSTDFIYWFMMGRRQRHPITMFCVFFSIDVVFLDADRKIMEMKEYLTPWSHYYPKNGFAEFIEFPVGFIKLHGLELGQQIKLDESKKSVFLKNS